MSTPARRPSRGATKGAAARKAVDSLCDLMESCGNPDGARLRAALAAIDALATDLRPTVADRDPVAAILERMAAKMRERKR